MCIQKSRPNGRLELESYIHIVAADDDAVNQRVHYFALFRKRQRVDVRRLQRVQLFDDARFLGGCLRLCLLYTSPSPRD